MVKGTPWITLISGASAPFKSSSMASSASLEVANVLSGAMRKLKIGFWVVGVVLRWIFIVWRL